MTICQASFHLARMHTLPFTFSSLYKKKYGLAKINFKVVCGVMFGLEAKHVR